MLLIRHYKKEQIYDILRSIFHFINCNSFIVIFTMCVCVCVCVDHCLFIPSSMGNILHGFPTCNPFCDFISKVVLLYCIYYILFVVFFLISLSIFATCDNDVRNMICHLWVGTRQYSIFIFP